MSEDRTPYLVDVPTLVSRSDDDADGQSRWFEHCITAVDQIGKSAALHTLCFSTRERLTDDALIESIRDAALEWVATTEAGRALHAAQRGHVSVEYLRQVCDEDLRALLAKRGVVARPDAEPPPRKVAISLGGNLLKWRRAIGSK